MKQSLIRKLSIRQVVIIWIIFSNIVLFIIMNIIFFLMLYNYLNSFYISNIQKRADMFINTLSHINESQRRELFNDVIKNKNIAARESIFIFDNSKREIIHSNSKVIFSTGDIESFINKGSGVHFHGISEYIFLSRNFPQPFSHLSMIFVYKLEKRFNMILTSLAAIILNIFIGVILITPFNSKLQFIINMVKSQLKIQKEIDSTGWNVIRTQLANLAKTSPPAVSNLIDSENSKIEQLINTLYLYHDKLEKELTKYEESLIKAKQADQYKTKFLTTINHQLRTPLNSIMGFSQFLLEGYDGKLTDEQYEDINIIFQSGKELLGLINDILDISAIASGKLILEKTLIDPVPVINQVVLEAKAQSRVKNVEIVMDIEDNIPQIWVDSKRLWQVLSNLVFNSLKYTDEGFIKIKLEKMDDYLKFSVHDTGKGISEKDIPNIFKEFIQSGSEKIKKSGLGLGLAICNNLVELHSGKLWVESEEGKGSIFYFTLPTNKIGNE